ncbi:uncharacterized protein TRUGW13939_10330, partial [Talaromyces rugulosus]
PATTWGIHLMCGDSPAVHSGDSLAVCLLDENHGSDWYRKLACFCGPSVLLGLHFDVLVPFSGRSRPIWLSGCYAGPWHTPGTRHCPEANASTLVFLAASETINSVIDFVMLALAIQVISNLQISMGEKLRIGVLFSLGTLSGIVGFIKITESYTAAYGH